MKKNSNKALTLTFALFFILLITAFSSFGYAKEEQAVRMIPQNFSKLSESVIPGVVNISAVKIIKGKSPVSKHYFFNGPFDKNDPMNEFFEKFFGEQNQKERKETSLGSGFIIDKEGYIVTNNHVIQNADEIKVKIQDGKELEAEIVGRDPETDLALIKVKTNEKLNAIKIGDSDQLKVGEWVIAIGSPFGLEHTVTAGIVSAKGRVIGSGPYDDFIQTDASINFGNSGGPLINMNGEVIGINTAIIAGGNGIGFAIPMNLAGDIIRQLKEHGEYARGWLGVQIQNLTEELAEYKGLKDTKGVLIGKVFPGDPADKAGIKANDIIVQADGKKIETSRELSATIAGIKAGKSVDITVLRNGVKKIFTVKIAKRESEKLSSSEYKEKEAETDELGISVADITPEIMEKTGITDKEGVIIINMDPDKKGSEAGLAKFDIIKEINRKIIKSKTDYKAAIKKTKAGETIKFYIKRADRGYMVVKLIK
ncbi:MAG: Do family serine endopeptidase [Deltaproteobacteria bacterium]|nr:Do family serine endopeptidase [Deltaproteobacteria bacterium]